jgi:CRP-like cAMP-binding protein
LTEQPRRRYPHYLLDLDPELAAQLEAPVRLLARPAATALTFALEPPQLELSRWLEAARGGPGLLLLSGSLVRYARVAGRDVAELVGRGDLLQTDGYEEEFIRCEYGWRVLERARLAILDAAFAERVKHWPQINQALLRRVERRVHHLAVQRAIAAHPRLEVRLVLLLWHLAARWGKVEPGGIRLPLPLTHHLLGRLVSAERPSVTHALKRLHDAGLIRGGVDGWHLRGSADEHLSALSPENILAGAHAPRPRPEHVPAGGAAHVRRRTNI